MLNVLVLPKAASSPFKGAEPNLSTTVAIKTLYSSGVSAFCNAVIWVAPAFVLLIKLFTSPSTSAFLAIGSKKSSINFKLSL